VDGADGGIGLPVEGLEAGDHGFQGGLGSD